MNITSSVGLRAHNRTDDVVKVQSLLRNFPDVVGVIGVDGSCGAGTVRAIKKFQKSIGLVMIDGKVDRVGFTIKHLNDRGEPLEALDRSNPNHYQYSDAVKQWAEPATLQFLKDVAEQMVEETGYMIGVGHLSLQAGGPFRPHKSHKHGEDIDLRPPRRDAKRLPSDIRDRFYSRHRAMKLVRIMTRHPLCKVILFNDDSIVSRKRKSWPGHDNHLHVRVLS